MIRPLLAIILASLLISTGGSGFTPIPTATTTPTPLLTIKVVSYNILFGAGVERKYDDILSPEWRNKNRLTDFLSFIDGIKPDILGVQEANGWNRGVPTVVQQAANRLEMNYYLA